MFSRNRAAAPASAAPAASQEGNASQNASSTMPSPPSQQQQQQQARRRNGGAPTLSQLSSSTSPAASSRSRVQAAAAAPSPPQQQQQPAAAAAAASADGSRGLRSRLMPLTSATAAASPPARSPAQQLFSVFTNPLSAGGSQADAPAAAETASSTSNRAGGGRSRAAASLTPGADTQQDLTSSAAAAGAAAAQVQAGPQAVAAAIAPDAMSKGAAADGQQTQQQPAGLLASAQHGVDTTNSSSESKSGQQCTQQHAGGMQRTYCFEVQADGSEPQQQLIDYNGHDQHSNSGMLYAGCGADGQLLGDGSIQQYVYDEDTGQLCRMGEGAETVRVGRHYLEDCHTGEFFQLAQQPKSGWWAWLRRRPHLGADGLLHGSGSSAPGSSRQQQRQQEPGILHSLSEFLDTMGSGMAALGLFAQGLAGGLALLCLFMTYIQYATAGRDGFLAFYSPQAEMINRTFFTLISISLVAAASRHAYDQLGHFSPRHLRLGLVDSLVMLLYFAAYTCNLLATPMDDQFAYEARRDPMFYTLPLPEAFERKLGLWHALNLVRVVCCGLAWIGTTYRSNHFIMLKVFEARREELEEEEEAAARAVAAGAGARVFQPQQRGVGVGSVGAGSRLQRTVTFSDRGGGGVGGS